jgi:hypothetical protein
MTSSTWPAAAGRPRLAMSAAVVGRVFDDLPSLAGRR